MQLNILHKAKAQKNSSPAPVAATVFSYLSLITGKYIRPYTAYEPVTSSGWVKFHE